MGCCNSENNVKINQPRAVGKNSTTGSEVERRIKKKKTATTTSIEDIRQVYNFTKRILGHGHFGTVRLASPFSNPQRLVAVKTIQKDQLKQNKFYMLKRELKILKQLDHPNIIKFHQTFQDTKYMHFVMEYCNGGELLDRFIENDNIDEQIISQIMGKLFSAVAYLHKNGIIHRDIKPENFIFKDKTKNSEIKIIDFGLSRKYEPNQHRRLSSMVGTPLYVAPEVLKENYDYRCDNWSLGVLIYQLLCGYPPFYAQTRKQVFKCIQNVDYDFSGDVWKTRSKHAKDLISKLLVKNVKKRYTAEEALNHAWIKNNMKDYKIDPSIINRLNDFKYQSIFKKEAVKVLIEEMQEADISKLKKQFKLLDQDNTGHIKFEELRGALQKTGFEPTTSDWKSIVENLRADSIMGINYTEFIAATMDRRIFYTKERLWRIFKHFDVDSTNMITVDNLREAMARNGRKVPQNELEVMLKEVDLKKNDIIDFDEFLRLMNIENEVDIFKQQSRQIKDSDLFSSDLLLQRNSKGKPKTNPQSNSELSVSLIKDINYCDEKSQNV